MPSSQPEPRIPPGGRKELGTFMWAAMQIASRRMGGPLPNVMLTLARHPSLFRPWLWFASRLMPNGELPAVDSELVILRVAAHCKSEYEHVQHVALAKQAGLGEAVIAWSARPDAGGIPAPPKDGIEPARAMLLIRTTDELLETHTLGDDTWHELTRVYGEKQLIELCMLVGQYAMLAGTLNALRVPLDAKVGQHKLR